MRTAVEQQTDTEPGEQKAGSSQLPSREPTRPGASKPFDQSVAEAASPVKAQPQAVRLDRKINEEQSTPPEVENLSSEPVTGQASLPLAPLAQPQTQGSAANNPEPKILNEPDRTPVQRSVVQNSKGEEAQTFEPIKKASPSPSQNIPPARSIEPVLPLAAPLAAADRPVQRSPVDADEWNPSEPSRQVVEFAGEPVVQTEPQNQNLPISGEPAADLISDKASEPVAIRNHKTSEPVTDLGPSTQHHPVDVERVAHTEPSIQKMPLAVKPPSVNPEPPERTPVQDSQLAAQLKPAELTLLPVADGLTHPETRIQKLPQAGVPSLHPEAPVQTSPVIIQPAELTSSSSRGRNDSTGHTHTKTPPGRRATAASGYSCANFPR